MKIDCSMLTNYSNSFVFRASAPIPSTFPTFRGPPNGCWVIWRDWVCRPKYTKRNVIDQLIGELGYSPMERKGARPTLDVNGIWGGFSGEGAKTIIPAKAGAKVSMRLVPKQKQARINRLFRDFVQSLTPPGIQLAITDLYGCDPVLVSRDETCVQAAKRAIEIGFGKAPVFIREGGSIPIVSIFKESPGMENILLLGWGNPDDGAHSPNERFSLDDFHRGIRSVAALFYELAPP